MSVCHDCNVEEGQIHEYGCDMERCPFCGSQLITCECCYIILELNYDITLPYSGLSEEIYKKGLSKQLYKEWMNILNRKGRVPYIIYPNICAKCGILYPDMFKVSNEEWKYYVKPDERDNLLCMECYNYIKEVIDLHKE